MRLSLVIPAILTILQMRFAHIGFQVACWNSLSLVVSYCATLFSSVIIYRAFFHPLKNYPGPKLAKITKLWHVFKISSLDNYRQIDRLHTQYGDFVRTGASNDFVPS